MMWRTGFTGVLALLFATTPALAQTGTITGKVTAVDGGQPIANAQVSVVGTTAGALTRDDGRFTIAVRPGTYSVRAARIGYAPDSVRNISVTTGSATTADITLRANVLNLSNVLVVGYGTEEARDKTGSIETVSAKDFNTGRVVSPEQLIEAKVPGVQVVDNNEPGGGISVRIRGGASVTSSNEPLFVVDGVPLAVGGGISAQRNPGSMSPDDVGRNPLNFLNPDDIETMTVLKDASATAIYGSRGANGVVMITTKSGLGRSGVTYTTSVSNSRVTGGPSLLDAAQFRAAVTKYAPENSVMLGSANTDWRKAVQRDAMGQDHSLAFSGNRSDMNYRLSVGYLDQDGVVQNTTVKRLSSSLNYSDKLFNNRLDVLANIKGTRTDDAFTPSGVLGSATAFAPTQPILGAAGTYYEYTDPLGPNNPLGQLALVQDKGTAYRSVGNMQAKYRLPFLDGLSATARLGYDVASANRSTFLPSTEHSQVESSGGGYFSRNSPSQTNTVLDAFGNYARVLERLNSTVDITAGYSYEQSRGETPFFFAQGLSSDLLGLNGVPSSKTEQNSLSIDESRLVSFFGRMNYSLRDRYLLTLSVRRDGSSKFGPEHQWGVFPSAALAWRVSDEGFMKRFTRISDLKVRASYGVNGNQAIPNYSAYSSYAIGGPQTQVQFGNTFITTIRPSASDPGIRWEQTTSNDIGIDYGVWNNRITGTLDYYAKKTKDLIFNVPVAAGTNLSNYVTTNIGSLENKGFELGLNARVIDGGRRGFSWDAGLNAATNNNRLLHINAIGAGNEQILTGGIAGGVGNNIEVLQPGYAVNSFFVYHHIRDASGNPIYADVNKDGTIDDQDLYQDTNGDKIINQNDRVPFHSPQPKWILGHSSTFSYGNADLGFTLRAYLGNYVYNNVASNLGHYSALKGAAPVNLDASVLTTGFVNPQYFSDVYVEDASFLRMDNLTLGYTVRNVPTVNAMRVFGTVQNVFTTTRYTGIDPTSGINGIDNNIYPRSRSFVAGATLQF